MPYGVDGKISFIDASGNIASANYSTTDTAIQPSGAVRLNIKRIDCTKYGNGRLITFINKFGVIQDLWFNKKRTDDLSVKRDSYDTNIILSSTSAVNYNTYNPSSVVQDVTSKKSLTLNTGFLKEEYNEVIRELFQSEDVWIRENNKTLPVKIKDSDFTYKTHLNDKLVNYTIQFQYAFDSINAIR